MTSPSPLERLAGPGNVLGKEAPDAKEFDGLVHSGLARLKDAENEANASSRSRKSSSRPRLPSVGCNEVRRSVERGLQIRPLDRHDEPVVGVRLCLRKACLDSPRRIRSNPLAVGRDRNDGGQAATVADTQAGLTIDGGNLESSMLAPDFLSQKDDVPGDRLGTDDGRARWTT